ncbi:hypothetical protein Tco_0664105, partial [Tanacetum coccineum]
QLMDGVVMPKRSRKILYDGGGGGANFGSQQEEKGGRGFEIG